MQKPCELRENENGYRTSALGAFPKEERRWGVKKADNVEK
jgi:hypothetical protein